MSSVNIAVIEGRLTADPVLLKTKSGTTICRFTIANNRYYLRDANLIDEVSFFMIRCCGPLADRVSACLKKGSLVLVSGTLKAVVGGSRTIVNASNIKILSKKSE